MDYRLHFGKNRNHLSILFYWAAVVMVLLSLTFPLGVALSRMREG